MSGDNDGLQWVGITVGLGILGFFFAMSVLIVLVGVVIGAIAAVVILGGGIKAWVGLILNKPKLGLVTLIATLIGSFAAIGWVNYESTQPPGDPGMSLLIVVPIILLADLGPFFLGGICLFVSMDEFYKPWHALSVALFTISIVLVSGTFIIAV